MIGRLLGGAGSTARHLLKAWLGRKLGSNNSVLAILIKRIDRVKAHEKAGHFGGQDFIVELNPETEAQLEGLFIDEAAAAPVQAELEIEEDNEKNASAVWRTDLCQTEKKNWLGI